MNQDAFEMKTVVNDGLSPVLKEAGQVLANVTDKVLDEAALKMHLFKSDKVKLVVCAIAMAFIDAPGVAVWPDEIKMPELDSTDKNIIGICWKQLAKWKLIERLEGKDDHRRSKAKGRRGGVVWRYRAKNLSQLRLLLRRNGVKVEPKVVQETLL